MIIQADNENHELKSVSIVQGEECALLRKVGLGWGGEGGGGGVEAGPRSDVLTT